jgi:hypothetical protein
MKIQWIALTLITAGTSLFADTQANQETAWERKTMDRCKKEMMKEDEATFSSSLSPFAKKQYQGFTPEQRKKAMDYADSNKMSPDDAVAKVMSQQ